MKCFFSFLLLTIIAFTSCQKDLIPSKTPAAKDAFAVGGVKYLKAHITAKEFNSLDLRSINLMGTDGKTIALKIAQKDTSNHKTAYIGKDSTGYVGNWATSSVDRSGDGLLITETFDGRIKKEIIFQKNVPARLVKTINGVSKTFEPVYRKDLEDTTAASVLTQ